MLKIESEVEEIPQSIGVRQGDNMAPVCLLFLMTVFAEMLKLVCKQKEIQILSIMKIANEHLANGNICSHIPAFK